MPRRVTRPLGRVGQLAFRVLGAFLEEGVTDGTHVGILYIRSFFYFICILFVFFCIFHFLCVLYVHVSAVRFLCFQPSCRPM